ncbi:MAG: YifB family Mg chelatase-like AAA ATPase [Myxococcota bacterium]
MVSQVRSAVLIGIEAVPLTVEVELASGGIPRFDIIGLGDTAVKESRHRVQAALRSAGLWEHRAPVMVNLAPADLRKDGAALDLAIALALLHAAGRLELPDPSRFLVAGELGLQGDIRPIRGALAFATLAQEAGYDTLVLPPDNHHEAAALNEIRVLSSATLRELVSLLSGRGPDRSPPPSAPAPRAVDSMPDIEDVCGHGMPRRALEIAAAGGHNLMLVGPPGCGKTMLARRLPGLLPPMTQPEAVEVTKVWSAAGLTHRVGLIRERPFRAPHPSVSQAGLIGGGSTLKPGEVSLAHRGVLFLDEIPELPRRVLEALRQPLEDRVVTLARARHSIRFPASFLLVAAMNPCPCGWLDHPKRRCVCSVDRIQRYQQRLSGPLLDRFDLLIHVRPVPPADIFKRASRSEGSSEVRTRVATARRRAHARQGCINAELSGRRWDALGLGSEGQRCLTRAADSLALSARSIDRVRRVARSIADLAGSTQIENPHVLEALQFRGTL